MAISSFWNVGAIDMTKLISNLRAFLFGTSTPPLRPETLYEHVHVGRGVRPAGDEPRREEKCAEREGERRSLEVSG